MIDKLAFSPDEAASRASIGRTFIFSEIKNGRLEAVKAGSRTLITRDAMTAWLESLPRRGALEAAQLMASKEKDRAPFEDGIRPGGIRRISPTGTDRLQKKLSAQK